MMSAFALLMMTNLAHAQAHMAAKTATASNTNEAEAIQLPDPLTEETATALVARLSDDQVRALLLERLNTVAAQQAEVDAGPSMVEMLDRDSSMFFTNLGKTILAAPKVPGVIGTAFTNFIGDRPLSHFLIMTVVLAAAFAVGYLAEFGISRLVDGRQPAGSIIDKASLRQKLAALFSSIGHDWLRIIVFAIAGIAVIALAYAAGSVDRRTLVMILLTVVVARLAHATARFLFAPSRPELRICRTDDQTASFMTRQITLIAGYSAASVFLITWLGDLGLRFSEARPGFWLGLILHGWIISVFWRARNGVTDMLIGDPKQASPGVRRFARAWPTIAMVLVGLQWLFIEILVNTGRGAQLSMTALFSTLIMILIVPAFDTMIRGLVSHFSEREDEISNAEAQAKVNAGLVRCGRVVLGGIIFVMLVKLWGIDIENVAQAGMGAQVASNIVQIALILIIAYAIWEFVHIVIARQLAHEMPEKSDDHEGAGDMGGPGGTRLGTVLPLLRASAEVAIIVLTTLAVLSELGINIAPLLAGAGIIGLAIGFGAQTLVRDIVSGMFFLLDDALRIGEYVDVGDTMGTVEKLSIRSLRLRHHRGPVHTVPYGDITKLTNFSRDWVIVKLKWRVPFDTDINQVKRIFKQIGKDLLQDEELGPDFLAPFKSQGVADIDDIGITVRGKFTAKPGKQFMIQREIYVRVQKAFEEAGIEFARRQVTVHIPGSEHLTPEQQSHVEQAALAAADAGPDDGVQEGKP
jgi:small-conductance mechanosensitive channel